MFSPKTILTQIQAYLPKLTDLFSTKLAVTGVIIAGTPQVLRLTSATAHGMLAGERIVINNALVNNKIVAVAFYAEDNIIRFTTQQKHDLTMDYDKNLFDGKIRLDGFLNTDLNDDFEIVSIPSAYMFEISYDFMTTFALSGAEKLIEKIENGLNQTWLIDSVTELTIDIKLTDAVVMGTGAVNQIESITNTKMDVVIDESTARKIYKSGYHLFVIMGDGVSAKDRQIDSDANNLNTSGSDQRQQLINDFSINVFCPTSADHSGIEAIELCWTTLLTYLINCLQGIKFDDYDNSDYLVSFLSHGSVRFDMGYYEHSYSFQYVYDITYEQSFIDTFVKSVPLDRIELSYNEKDDGSYIDLTREGE